MCLKRSVRALSCALLLATLAGCASVDVQSPARPAAAHPAFAQAGALASAHAGLAPRARAENAHRIDALLAQLDDAALARQASALPAGDPLYNFAAQALRTRGLPLPRPFDRTGWRIDAAARPPAERDGYRPPLRVALLLPLSGSLAAAAEPVRDGFLAGYYAESRRRPEVRFYDTAGGAAAAYARAAAEGNDFVVGPLAREDVDAVFAGDAPAVPLLALNRGSLLPPPGSATFSLSPEDEGVAAAEYLLRAGARRVLVVAGNDDVQRRAAGALADHLQARGAQVAARIEYADAPLTLPADARPDAVFLALRGPQARNLAPRLDAAGLAGKPRVAASQIASGSDTAAENVALDGIVHPTEAWEVRSVPGLPSQPAAAARLASARGPAARLFAFGHDAWLATAYLERLALDPQAEIAGATGSLSLDGLGRLQRRPAWVRFSGGVQVPLADGGR